MKSFSFKIAILAILLCGGAFFTLSSREKIEECENVFSSGVYREYRRQLREYVQSQPFYEEVCRTCPLIENLEAVSLPDRESHEAFVKQLRSLINHTPDGDSRMVDAIVKWIYLEVDLTGAYQDFIAFDSSEDPLSALLADHKRLRADPHFTGRERHSKEEDEYLFGNLPSVYAFAPGRVIRCAKPLSYSSRYPWFSSRVSPEFRRFAALQPGHLYINLMKRKGKEGRDSRAIEELEREFPNLHVVTLDKDSPFYRQEEEEQNDAEIFKKAFLAQMLVENGNFYWSLRLDSSWKEELQAILENVHEAYFSQQPILNRSEKQDFIELAYLEIIDTLLAKWNPPSMNITCSQGMDRGPSLLVLWEIKHRELPDNAIASQLLTPPLLIHNRPSHPARIQRFVSAARRL